MNEKQKRILPILMSFTLMCWFLIVSVYVGYEGVEYNPGLKYLPIAYEKAAVSWEVFQKDNSLLLVLLILGLLCILKLWRITKWLGGSGIILLMLIIGIERGERFMSGPSVQEIMLSIGTMNVERLIIEQEIRGELIESINMSSVIANSEGAQFVMEKILEKESLKELYSDLTKDGQFTGNEARELFVAYRDLVGFEL